MQRFDISSEIENINDFELIFDFIRYKSGRIIAAKPQILVDGNPINEKLPVDLWQLVASLKKGGPTYIYTCGCGDATCGGVEDGVLVSHKRDLIIWEYRLPQSTDGFGTDSESAYETWLKKSTLFKRVFDRQQMIESIYAALIKAEASHPEDISYPPQGFERHHIGELIAKVEKLRK